MPLGGSPDIGITWHKRDGFNRYGKDDRFKAESCAGKRCLASRVTRSDYAYIRYLFCFSVRIDCFHFFRLLIIYFPIQNLENISFTISSLTSAPVIEASDLYASVKSIQYRSSDTPDIIESDTLFSALSVSFNNVT